MALASSQYRSVEPARIEQRAEERHPVVLHRATVRGIRKLPQEAKLADLSVYGCRIDVDGRFEAGERLWLRLSGSQPVAATAIWFDGESMGCRFDEQLDRALFRSLTLASS
jgi:hypothetical protein